jgi:hypothetical protein
MLLCMQSVPTSAHLCIVRASVHAKLALHGNALDYLPFRRCSEQRAPWSAANCNLVEVRAAGKSPCKREHSNWMCKWAGKEHTQHTSNKHRRTMRNRLHIRAIQIASHIVCASLVRKIVSCTNAQLFLSYLAISREQWTPTAAAAAAAAAAATVPLATLMVHNHHSLKKTGASTPASDVFHRASFFLKLHALSWRFVTRSNKHSWHHWALVASF